MFSDVFVLFHFNHKDNALPVFWIMTWESTKSTDTDIDNSISHSHQIEELGFDLVLISEALVVPLLHSEEKELEEERKTGS